MVKLEDIPDIPKGQEALRVEVTKVVEGDTVLNLTKMYYMTGNSRILLQERGALFLYDNIENGEYHGLTSFKLEDIKCVSPMSLRE